MVWFRVDDTLPFHERVIRAGNAAMGLWVRAGAWSSGQLTDGHIPTLIAKQLGTNREIQRLVDVGLWHEAEGGFVFHAWAEDGTGAKRQPTRAEVEKSRRDERERKAAYRQSRRDTAPTPPDPTPPVPQGVPAGHRPDVRPESGQASGYPDPTRPDPTLLRTEPAIAGSTASTELALVEPAGNRSEYPAGFEAWWAVYPRHEGKRKALAAWQAARRRAGSELALVEGARRYAADPNRDPAFTAHPTTWLNRDGWEDAPLPTRGPASKPDRIAAAAGRMMHELGAQAQGR